MVRSPSGWPIVGHQAVVAFLQRSFARGAVSHAYLMVGPAQVGKTTLAAHWAAVLVCANPQPGAMACGACVSCVRRLAQTHPDHHWVMPEAGSADGSGPPRVSLERVQELQTKLSRRPVISPRTVAVIADAHTLTESAVNAWLKTLEEPRGQTTLVLTAENLLQLPATVRSRCQLLRMSPLPAAEIAAALKARGVSHGMALELAEHAAGCPGRAFEWITDAERRHRFVSGGQQLLALMTQPVHERLQSAAALLKTWNAADVPVTSALREQLQSWTMAARNQLLSAVFVPAAAGEAMPARAVEHDLWRWRNFLDELREAGMMLYAHVNPRLVLETVLLAVPSRT